MTKTDAKQMGCLITGDMKKEVEEYLEDTGMSGAAFLRKGAQMMLDDNKYEGQLIMNIIMLTQKLQEVRGDLKEKDYKDMEDLVVNITKLKAGGK